MQIAVHNESSAWVQRLRPSEIGRGKDPIRPPSSPGNARSAITVGAIKTFDTALFATAHVTTAWPTTARAARPGSMPSPSLKSSRRATGCQPRRPPIKLTTRSTHRCGRQWRAGPT